MLPAIIHKQRCLHSENIASEEYDPEDPREFVDLERANLVSSLRIGEDPNDSQARHAILLDLDLGAEIVDGGPFHERTRWEIDLGQPPAVNPMVMRGISTQLEDLDVGFIYRSHSGHLVLHTWHEPTVIESSTEGHAHLYIDVDIRWQPFMRLLVAFAALGLVEPGYVQATIARGHADLRLPGVIKPPKPEGVEQKDSRAVKNFDGLMLWVPNTAQPAWCLR